MAFSKRPYFAKFFEISKKKASLYLFRSSFVLLIPLGVFVIGEGQASRWDVAAVYFVLCFLSLALIKGQRDRFFVLVFLCLSFMTVGIEHFTLMDRWNTLFKFNYGLRILLSLPLVLLLMKHSSRFSKLWRWSFISFAIVGVALTDIYLFSSLRDYSQSQGQNPLFSLNVRETLRRFGSVNMETSEYLLKHERHPVAVLEAPSSSYNYRAPKVGPYSGHASFVAWSNHLKIHGVEQKEVARRTRLAENMYRGRITDNLHSLLEGERVSYVLIGHRELKKYGKKSLQKLIETFEQQPKKFGRVVGDLPNLFQKDDAVLYELK